MDLGCLAREGAQVLESEFGVKPEKSTYHTYPFREWEQFCSQTRLANDRLGIFLPRSLSAHLPAESEFLPVTFIHEYFGHGLFCEHSIIGRRIVSLEQELAEVEKIVLGVEALPPKFHFQIDSSNPHFVRYRNLRQELQQFFAGNVQNYEGFALWLEQHLANLMGYSALFEKKLGERLDEESRLLFEELKDWETHYGEFAFVYQMGFPKHYDRRIVLDILKRFYGGGLVGVSLALLYGSRKPYSDIDVFTVSDELPHIELAWLDVFSMSREKFEDAVNNLDIYVTDVLFSGDPLVDVDNQLQGLRQQILEAPITEQIIAYNRKRGDEEGRVVESHLANSKERRKALAYQRSYEINAAELEQGRKALTFQNIKERGGV